MTGAETSRYQFPDAGTCDSINADAYFLPAVAGPHQLPALIVGGVCVFVYADPETGAVRVSVDLDGTQPELVRPDPDSTLPLRVEVSGQPVFDEKKPDAVGLSSNRTPNKPVSGGLAGEAPIPIPPGTRQARPLPRRAAARCTP